MEGLHKLQVEVLDRKSVYGTGPRARLQEGFNCIYVGSFWAGQRAALEENLKDVDTVRKLPWSWATMLLGNIVCYQLKLQVECLETGFSGTADSRVRSCFRGLCASQGKILRPRRFRVPCKELLQPWLRELTQHYSVSSFGCRINVNAAHATREGVVMRRRKS